MIFFSKISEEIEIFREKHQKSIFDPQSKKKSRYFSPKSKKNRSLAENRKKIELFFEKKSIIIIIIIIIIICTGNRFWPQHPKQSIFFGKILNHFHQKKKT